MPTLKPWAQDILKIITFLVDFLIMIAYNKVEDRNVLLHHLWWVLWRFRQDGKIKTDRMMKLITRGWKVSRFIFRDMSEFPLKVYLLNRVADFPKEKIMNLPENDYQILRLTDAFYNAYPNPPYKEILKKKQRAYNCLLLQTHYIIL